MPYLHAGFLLVIHSESSIFLAPDNAPMSYAVRTIGRLPNQGEPYGARHGRKINQNNSLLNIFGESPAPTLGSAANSVFEVTRYVE